jgi:hypothetical protein
LCGRRKLLPGSFSPRSGKYECGLFYPDEIEPKIGGIQGMSKALPCNEVPVLIDQQRAFGLGFFDDLAQSFVYVLNLILIEDLLLLSQW